MLSHVFIGTNDPDRASGFYDPIMDALGWRLRHSETPSHLVIWNPAEARRPLFVLGQPFDGKAADPVMEAWWRCLPLIAPRWTTSTRSP